MLRPTVYMASSLHRLLATWVARPEAPARPETTRPVPGPAPRPAAKPDEDGPTSLPVRSPAPIMVPVAACGAASPWSPTSTPTFPDLPARR
jgi:hypothetical protein